MSAIRANRTPGPASRVALIPPSKAMAGQQHADGGDDRARGLHHGQRLAAEDHRQDDGQAAERCDCPADDRDRAELESREIGHIGTGSHEALDHGDPDRPRIAWQGRPGGDDEHGEFDRGDEEHPGGDPQAADHPAFEGRDDVEGSPGQRRGEAGQESEGHRRA